MPAPQGEALTLMVDGQEMQVQIEPQILSRKGQEAISRHIRKQNRDAVWQDLVDLRSADIPMEVKEELKAGYMQALQKNPDFNERLTALSTPGGLIAILEAVSNLTHEDAKRAVSDSENFAKLVVAVAEVTNREGESVKN